MDFAGKMRTDRTRFPVSVRRWPPGLMHLCGHRREIDSYGRSRPETTTCFARVSHWFKRQVNGLFEALRFSDSTVPTYGTRVSEGSAMLKLHGTFNRLVGYGHSG